MLSEKKLEANRRNAQLSTGPRTPEGKAVVSRNAITHGLRASHTVLFIEKGTDFRELCESLAAEYCPMSPTESCLVEDMALSRWKLARLEAIENSLCLQSAMVHVAYADPLKFRTGRDTILIPSVLRAKAEQVTAHQLDVIGRQQARLERSFHRAHDTLLHIQALHGRPNTGAIARPLAREKAMAAGMSLPDLDGVGAALSAFRAGSSA